MARTADIIVREMLGDYGVKMAVLQAQVEELMEKLAKAEAARPTESVDQDAQ